MAGNPNLDFPGAYNLSNPVILVNSVGERQNLALGIIAELNSRGM